MKAFDTFSALNFRYCNLINMVYIDGIRRFFDLNERMTTSRTVMFEKAWNFTCSILLLTSASIYTIPTGYAALWNHPESSSKETSLVKILRASNLTDRDRVMILILKLYSSIFREMFSIFTRTGTQHFSLFSRIFRREYRKLLGA